MRHFARGRLMSIGYALAGIRHLVRTQANARLHLVATVGVVAAGVGLRVCAGDWCWLIVAVGMVWGAEAMNTALEILADAVCPERHPLIGRAKDVAAGAVLLAAVGAAGIGVCVFVPRMGW